jgi:ABC-2 type transport system permease protein
MKVLIIAEREVSALLGSVIGWLLITAFGLISGVVFFLAVLGYSQSSEQLVVQPYGGFTLEFSEHLLWPYFSFQSLFLLFLLPGVTMRLFSEEVRQRTLEFLETAPVHTSEIVLGKFVGAMAYTTLLIGLTGWAPILLWLWSSVDPMLLLTGMAAVWLSSACIVALGMAASAATSHQVVALVLTEAFAFALLLVTGLEGFDPTGALHLLAITPHTEDLARGLLRLSDATYFIMFTLFFLLATHQRLILRRWV